ncbi:MAG: nucleotidyltransferase domain-containing protein [Methanomicrobiales archaeon]|nr:nucleotidyltransferase domain-containing protein [Methanomicrobiales archaeon]
MKEPDSLKSISVLTPSVLQVIIRRIVAATNPDKIILFGSYATGKPDKDSDLDLLVIMHSSEPRHRRAPIINRALAGLLIPKDILVYTPEEIEEWKDVPLAFITQVMKTGVVVYDKKQKVSEPGPV